MRVGKGRIKMPAVAMDAFAHGALEGGVRPAADAGLDVGRDVGAVDEAERRFDGAPAGVEDAVGRGMAGRAVAERGELPAAFDGRGGEYRRVRLFDRRDRSKGQDRRGNADAAGDQCGGGREDATALGEWIGPAAQIYLRG